MLLSLALFAIGTLGVFLRRNVITVLMCIELMLNGVNLAFVAFSRVHGDVTGQVFVSQGRTDLMFRWGLASSLANVASFVIGLPWGIRGIALAYSGANALMWYPVLAAPLRLIGVSTRLYVKAVSPTLAISLAMGGGALAWRYGMAVLGVANPWYLLSSTAAGGGVIYLALLLLAWPAAVDDLTLVLSQSGPPSLRSLAVRFRYVRLATRGLQAG